MDLFGAGRKGSIGTGYRCRRSQPDESIRISRERFPGRDRDYHFGFPCAKGSRRFFRRFPNRIICPAIIVTAWEACAPRDVWSPPSGIWRGRGGGSSSRLSPFLPGAARSAVVRPVHGIREEDLWHSHFSADSAASAALASSCAGVSKVSSLAIVRAKDLGFFIFSLGIECCNHASRGHSHIAGSIGFAK